MTNVSQDDGGDVHTDSHIVFRQVLTSVFRPT